MSDRDAGQQMIAGFWRRLGALLVDVIVLGIIGMILGTLAFDWLASIGVYGQVIGLSIAWLYFGLFNSRMAGAQTPGNRLLDVRVVDVAGAPLGLIDSLLRSAILVVPWLAETFAEASFQQAPLAVQMLLALMTGGGVALIYLYLFNRRTRQSLHDLVVGSFVVKGNVKGVPVILAPVWRGHYVVLALIALLTFLSPIMVGWMRQSSTLGSQLSLLDRLLKQPHVLGASVMSGTVYSSKYGRRDYTTVALRLDAPMIEDGAFALQMAQLVVASDPQLPRNVPLVISLRYGFTLGIATSTRIHTWTFNPAKLQEAGEP